MRVPFTWLKEFVEIGVSPGEVADRLTMAGFEVEGVDSVEGEAIFDVSVTPNRPDCLSVLGIAREVAAITQMPLVVPPCRISGSLPDAGFSVDILDPDLCNRYAGRVISGVTVGTSPEWMKKRLEQCGIRSINNVVDVTNYVLLEMGHPLHAFDADRLAGKKVRVGTPATVRGRNEPIAVRTLDGVERSVPPDALLIWDAEKPIAVAGVMGGQESEVTSGTRTVFLESAYFESSSIRRTSRGLGLISESSYRFERGTDIEFLERALDRAAGLIAELAGGTVHDIVDAYPVRYVSHRVVVRPERLNRILGTDLSRDEMADILRRLQIPAEGDGDEIVVLPPPNRRDLKQMWDIAEEVARIYGYEKISTTIPRSPLSSGRSGKGARIIQQIRESLRRAGFSAAINYSFMNSTSLDALGIPPTDRRRRTIAISNPLSQDEGLLRTTVVPALIANLRLNLDRGMREVRLFEVARVFIDAGKTLPDEEWRLGGIWYKEKAPSLWREDAEGFYLVKGAIEMLFEELNVRGYDFRPCSETFLHAGRSADVVVSGSCVGYIGVLAPRVVAGLEIKKHRPEIVLFEIDLDRFLPAVPDSMRFSPLPKFPSVERDIAVIVDEQIPSSRIREIIASFPTHLIETVTLFDCFRGGSIPPGKKSLAFNIVYRSMERTLTEGEVEDLHERLVEHVLELTSGEIRR